MMKKTIIALMALAGVAAAAETITLTSGGDITDELSPDVVTAITTVDSTAYSLQMPAGTVSISINSDLYVDSFLGAGSSSVTLNFGENGSITAGYYMNFGSKSSTTWNVSLSSDSLADLKYGDVYERTLLEAKGTYYGIWNIGSNDANTEFAYAQFNDIVGLSGYTNKGIINANEVDTLQAGQYALVFKEGEHKDNLKLVVVAVPEPTTATLSLLALAGLAARRRRR